MSRTAGTIYILRNSSFAGTLVKIGKTMRGSEHRAKELSAATGVPEQFEVLYEEPVPDIDLAERLIHQELDRFRLNARREFFNLPLKDAVRAVNQVCLKLAELEKSDFVPRLYLHLDQTISPVTPATLADVLEPFRGGETQVIVGYKKEMIGGEILLPADWKVDFSPKLIAALRTLGTGVTMRWSLANGEIKFDEDAL